MDDETNLQHSTVSRRTLLKTVGTGVGALALLSAQPSTPAQAATFYKGADISWVQQMEANGYIWKNSSGVQQDILTILKGYGINAIRLRTWVNPSSDPANGHCSITETAAMAVRCKNAGLPVDIDFHFGDTWNSGGVQNPPAIWASMAYSQMPTAMNNDIVHLTASLKREAVIPPWVRVGCETTAACCHC